MKRTALCLLVLAAGFGRSLAVDSPRPIDGPVTITESGSYLVTHDIAVAVPPAITIEAQNVVVDINGKTISTPGFDTGGLIVMNPASRQLFLRNGIIQGGGRYVTVNTSGVRLKMDHVTLSGGQYGIKVLNASNISITDCNIDSERFPFDISGSYPLVFERNNMGSRQYSSTGIYFSGITSGSFSWNHVGVSTYQGGFMTITSAGLVRMTHNVFAGDNGWDGLTLSGGPYVFTDNRVSGGHPTGVNLNSSGSLIINNVIEGGGGISTGLSIGGSNNVVSGNTVRNRWTGMAIGGTNNTISGNSVLGSGEYGMNVYGSQHTILGNRVGSHFAGFTRGLILYGNDNVYKLNDLRGNGRLGDPNAWDNGFEDHGSGNVDAGGNLLDPPPCESCGLPD